MHFCTGGSDAGSPTKMGVAGLSPRLRPEMGGTNEVQGVERLQGKCSHLQGELEKVRRQLATEREEFHVKECKMEASLTTAHKTNQELEVCQKNFRGGGGVGGQRLVTTRAITAFQGGGHLSGGGGGGRMKNTHVHRAWLLVAIREVLLCSLFSMQRSIQALKLKSSVEKATLNDLHMNTIRVRLESQLVASVLVDALCVSSPC